MANGHGGARPGSGRPKGTRNRRTAAVQDQLEEIGCDPVSGLARLAKKAEKAKDLRLAVDCLKALLPCVAPRLRHIDVASGPMRFEVVGVAERLDAALNRVNGQEDEDGSDTVAIITGISAPPGSQVPRQVDDPEAGDSRSGSRP